MCILCEIKKAAANAAGFEIKEVVLGSVTDYQLKELIQLEEAGDKLEDQIKGRIRALINEGKVKEDVLPIVEMEFKDKFDGLQKLNNKAIDEIRAQHNISIEDWDESKINRKTLQIIKEITVPLSAPGVH